MQPITSWKKPQGHFIRGKRPLRAAPAGNNGGYLIPWAYLVALGKGGLIAIHALILVVNFYAR